MPEGNIRFIVNSPSRKRVIASQGDGVKEQQATIILSVPRLSVRSVRSVDKYVNQRGVMF